MPARSRVRRTKPPLDVEALWAIKRIGAPTISPDGRSVCVPVTAYEMEKNDGSTELWLLPTRFDRTAGATPKPRRLTAGDKDSEPRWSPDGRSIAFTAKRKDDSEPQIYVIAPDGGEARKVTSFPTGASAIKWFADGKRIAFVSWVWRDLDSAEAQGKRLKERKDAKVKANLTERGEYRFWDHWLTDDREPHLFICDVASGRCTDALKAAKLALPPWDPSVDHYDIAPDGNEIALTIDPNPEPGLMHQTDIVVLRPGSRTSRNLTAKSGMSDEHPRYSPDGKSIVYRSVDTNRAFNDQGHLRVIERRSGKWRRVGPKLDRPLTHVDWTPDSKALLFLLEDRGRVGMWTLPLSAAEPVAIVRGGTLTGYARSRDGRVVAYTRSTAMHPPAVFAARGDGSDERAIEALNRALMARHSLGEVREFTVRGWRGEPVQMFVTYPPNFDPKKKWPMMHSIHGGPHAAHHDGWHFRWNTQVFAGAGYVVPCVNYHGSTGFGQKFIETITKRYGEKEFADTEAATDFMLRRGYIDRRRLSATGGSYGGFMVAYMNGNTDRYRAYVCHAGCYDWVSMMATDGYRFFADELGAFHWDNEALVARQSPHHYVKRAKTPTLVVHGELDYRVPATQALQYYNSLKAKKVPARLVHFPDENHWILKPQNSKLWYREFFAWLERWTK